MKPRVRLATVAAFLIAVSAVTPVMAGQAKQDLAWGSATRSPLTGDATAPSFQINASSNTDGSGSAGTFILSAPSSGFVATVNCLNVNGHAATMSGRINTATGGLDGVQGWWFVAVIQDNGTASKRHPSPDTMSAVYYGDETYWANVGYTQLGSICRDGPNALVNFGGSDAMYGLVSGDYTVIDR